MLVKELDPLKAAKSNQVLRGEIAFENLARLNEMLTFKSSAAIINQPESISYCWSFFVDKKQQAVATLELKGLLTLICERCREPFTFKLQTQVFMQVVNTEAQAEALALNIEPLMMDQNNLIFPQEILEDEIILALPITPKHDEKDCSFFQNKAYYPIQKEEKTYKPFVNLGKMMNSKE